MFLAEDTITASPGVWGFLTLVGVALIGLAGNWLLQRKRGAEDEGKHSVGSSERLAAQAASNEILEWIEEHTIKPMQADLARLREKADELQSKLELREEELAEAKSLIRDLQRQLAEATERLSMAQAQIALLFRQLGVGEPDAPGR